MNHHTVTSTFGASRDEVFAYLADIEKLPEWATEFARELKLVDGHHKVVNGLGEFLFELHADAAKGDPVLAHGGALPAGVSLAGFARLRRPWLFILCPASPRAPTCRGTGR